MIIVDYRVGHSGAQSQVPLCSTKNIAFFAFQGIDVQKMRKVLQWVLDVVNLEKSSLQGDL